MAYFGGHFRGFDFAGSVFAVVSNGANDVTLTRVLI
ncbi:MAG: hypothetical protein ACI9MK_000855 [Oceanospirillaceae bacterium]